MGGYLSLPEEGGVRGIFSVILQCRFKKSEFIGDGGLVHVYSWQAYKYICSVRVHDQLYDIVPGYYSYSMVIRARIIQNISIFYLLRGKVNFLNAL